MYVRGVGKVRVTRKPKRIPKTIKLGNKKFKVSKSMYNAVWASEHQIKPKRRKVRYRRH